MRPGILTLTTDFGAGPYVASVKGIILGLAPGTQLVDVSHTIAPQNILEGAFVLSGIVESFPPGTVHLAVVDPGVGTERRMVAVSVADQWFVAPDNGVLSAVVRGRTPASIRELTNPRVRRRVVSHTFHGRDIMAPAAAHLLRGDDPAILGPELKSLITLANFDPRVDETALVGEVLFRDAFGNLITNIHAELLANAPPEHWTIEVAGTRVVGLHRTYGDQPPGSLVALSGSSGWIEIAVVNGDAARHLTAGPGTTVWFRKT
ncbi:MAG: SAM-dependent chlorinase/fluorinase [Isosphaeraceae bacterium]